MGTSRLAVGWLVVLALLGCAGQEEDPAAKWMARMDAAPPAQRVPHWEQIRALMLRQAPRVGDPAPDIDLQTRDGTGTFHLRDLRGKKPVVLVFGSWT